MSDRALRYWHIPFVQMCPGRQATPHPPQFCVLVLRFAQTPEQLLVPAGQAQLLFMQTRLPRHTCAQKPQLSLSFCKSTHEFPHRARPEPQLLEHAPLLQTCPIMQRFPHDPQLPALDCKSTHACWPMPTEQTVVPGVQRQLPFMHDAPNGHWFPHAPQLPLLVWRSTQTLPIRAMHDVCPVGHPIWHAPLMHWLPPPQRLLHVPQLRGSVCVSVHCPLQLCSPPPHMQLPFVQLAPAPHALLHAPQSKGFVCRFTHALPHLVVPAAHESVHAPSEHT